MTKLYGSIIWIDDRTKQFEGQIKDESGKRWYFNYSTWKHGLGPVTGEAVKFYVDDIGITVATDLCGSLN